MVGGSSQVKLMQRKLEERFPSKVVCVNNPDIVVAEGACKMAWLYESSMRGAVGASRALTIADCVPIGLGMETTNSANQA